MKIIEEYNALFPREKAVRTAGACTIAEHEDTVNLTSSLREVTYTGVDSYLFPHLLPKKLSGSFQKLGIEKDSTYGALLKDCDGIFCVDREGTIHVYFCELKSSFSTQEIIKAKDQIIGSYLKVNSLLQLLQGYRSSKFVFHGIIVSYEASTENLAYLKTVTRQDERFVSMIYNERQYMMPTQKLEAFYQPIVYNDLLFHYVPVPAGQLTYSFPFANL